MKMMERVLAPLLALLLAGSAPALLAADERDEAGLRERLAEAREALAEASREIAEVSRQLGEEGTQQRWQWQGSQRPVIGVVLGRVDGEPGARIMAVAAGGPAQQGGGCSGGPRVAVGSAGSSSRSAAASSRSVGLSGGASSIC